MYFNYVSQIILELVLFYITVDTETRTWGQKW